MEPMHMFTDRDLSRLGNQTAIQKARRLCATFHRSSTACLESYPAASLLEQPFSPPKMVNRGAMPTAEWEDLVARMNRRSDVSKVAKELDGRYLVDTLLAIFWQACTRKTIKNHWKLRAFGPQFVEKYKAGTSLLEIAEEINHSPVMVARNVMDLHFSFSKQNITKMIRNPSLVPDARLKLELQQCIDKDMLCGPRVDTERAVLGMEYENRLFSHLRNLGLEFETEHDLRKRGAHKTPDVLLRIPVCFGDKIVKWIDSKAKFGDKSSMERDYDESIVSYANRYGPGMVIYWFGFITDCDILMHRDKEVFVSDGFPQNVFMLPGSSLFHKSNQKSVEESGNQH